MISKCIRPYFVNGDFVIIHWYFKFIWKDGSVTEIEEITKQEWNGERIQKEQFFYVPKQRTPK